VESNKVYPAVKNLVKPNGVVGTPDGKTLYVADHGAGRIYKYAIKDQGQRLSLVKRKLFTAETGSDGMTLDELGNVYVTDTTTNSVKAFTPDGSCVLNIPFAEKVTNLVFRGKVLYLTGSENLYSLKMQVNGASYGDIGELDTEETEMETTTSPAQASKGQCLNGCYSQKKKSWSTKCSTSFWESKCAGCPECSS